MSMDEPERPYSDYSPLSSMWHGYALVQRAVGEPEEPKGGLTALGLAIIIMLSEAFGLGVGYLVWGW